MKRVLIACEESQAVCIEMRRIGLEAYSCDIEPCSGGHPEWHIKGDVLPLLKEPWDMVIAFPPCTYLCSSGLHWNKRTPGRQEETEKALDFVSKILNCGAMFIALENPIGCISTKIRKYDAKIQPWQFGHDASKGTCLWLKGIPSLVPTKIIPPKKYSLVKYAFDCIECPDCGEPFCLECADHYADCKCIGPTQDDATYIRIDGFEFATLEKPAPRPVWSNQTPSGQNKLGPSPDRGKIRATTYSGIARAMAEQWGKLL